eukprot:IDg119t1
MGAQTRMLALTPFYYDHKHAGALQCARRCPAIRGILLPAWIHNHTYVPASGDDPHKFRHLDLFVTDHSLERRRARHARRHKKHARGKEARVRLPGWKPEGWAELESDNSRDPVSLGFTRSVRGRYARIAFVFSRSGHNVTLPTRSWVQRKLKGVPTRRGKYTVLVSEANGYASKRPRLSPALAAKQTSVRAGERCPSWLHDTWAVDGDETDPHTAGVRFRTHHPLWDPCFWCAYDHEHGSDASALMGYTPRFGYTALKNGREEESHTGFKGFVLQLRDGLRMYYMVHAKLSEARRFSAQRHTVVVAVTNSSD